MLDAGPRPFVPIGAQRHVDDSGPDAVRFTISRSDSTGLLLYFVQERDHHPFAQGPLEYSFAAGFGASVSPLLQRQATAYIESYQRRVSES